MAQIRLPGPAGWSYELGTKNLNWTDGKTSYTERYGTPSYNATLSLFSYSVPGFGNRVAIGTALGKRGPAPLIQYAPTYAHAGQLAEVIAPDASVNLIFGEARLS